MTSQMSADDTLMIWQANRHLSPEGRISLIEKMEGWGMSGAKILEGMKGAVAGNFASVTIEGQRWVRADAAGWLPIETAPKDGEIWAFNGGHARMKWLAGDNGADTFALWIYADELLCDVDPDPIQPTHWMPLPTPPEVQA